MAVDMCFCVLRRPVRSLPSASTCVVIVASTAAPSTTERDLHRHFDLFLSQPPTPQLCSPEIRTRQQLALQCWKIARLRKPIDHLIHLPFFWVWVGAAAVRCAPAAIAGFPALLRVPKKKEFEPCRACRVAAARLEVSLADILVMPTRLRSVRCTGALVLREAHGRASHRPRSALPSRPRLAEPPAVGHRRDA